MVSSVSPRFSSQRSRRRRLLPMMVVLLSLFAFPAFALAHPMGNFTVNNYSRLAVGSEQVDLFYVLDMAEIPAFQERTQTIDSDGDGTVSGAEQGSYLDSKVSEIVSLLRLEVNGQQLPLELLSQQIEFPEGQGGLNTLRVSAHLLATLPSGEKTWEVQYSNFNDTRRLGWKEIVVQPSDEVTLLHSTVPAEDVSNELRMYPTDLLQNPLSVSEATFGVRLGAGASVESTTLVPVTGLPAAAEGFEGLINQRELSLGAMLLTLLAAFGWGAAHAMTPGHGKTIVAAYLVGTRGTVRHAIFLGLTTTVTHTAGVFALGFITLFLSRYILPEQLYPWLGVMSGLLVVGIGFSLFGQRLRAYLNPDAAHGDFHDHDHADGQALLHTHNGTTHNHLPPGTDGAPVTWRRLLALGISGGLIPCPSALIVLLGAIALQRVGFGLLLITVFSIGLASVLTGIGIMLVHAKKLFNRVPASGPLLRVVPIASAFIITLVGLGITLQALAQTGALHHLIVASAELF